MLEREEEEKEEALIGRVDVIRARIHVEEANAVSVSLFFFCAVRSLEERFLEQHELHILLDILLHSHIIN